MYWLPSAVKSSGAVSPATRATASSAPVRMPGSAVMSTICRLVRQRWNPRASAASRSELGTSLIISSVVRITIGTIRMARATEPANPEKCFWFATIQVQAKTPITMEGVPLSTSATKRVIVASLLPGYSAENIPAPMPTGMPIRQAMITDSPHR